MGGMVAGVNIHERQEIYWESLVKIILKVSPLLLKEMKNLY